MKDVHPESCLAPKAVGEIDLVPLVEGVDLFLTGYLGDYPVDVLGGKYRKAFGVDYQTGLSHDGG